MYSCLPVNKRRVGEGGAVNRNDELHSVSRGRLNRLAQCTKGYSKIDVMLTLFACVGTAEVGLDLLRLHVLRMPNIRCPNYTTQSRNQPANP